MNLWEQLERVSADARATTRGGWGLHAPRVALVAALASLTYALFPAAPASNVAALEVGAVAPDNVIAPFAYGVPKSDGELARERTEAAAGVLPVYALVPAAADSARSALASLDRALAAAPPRADAVTAAASRSGVRLAAPEAAYLAAPDHRRALFAALRATYDETLPLGVAAGPLDSARGTATVVGAGGERTVGTGTALTMAALLDRARARLPEGDGTAASALGKLLGATFRATLVPRPAEYQRRRLELARAVDPLRYQVQAGEKIVGAHEVVGREQFEKLGALRAAALRPAARMSLARVAGALLYDALIFLTLGVTLALFRPHLYRSFRAVLLVALVLAATVAGAAVVSHTDPVRLELLPVAFAAIVFGVVFDSRISVVSALLVAILLGVQGPYRGANALFVALVGGVAAAFSTRLIRRRNDAFFPIAIIALAYAVGSVTIGLSLDWNAATIVRSAGWGAANAVVSVSLALMVLPAAEEFTGIDTYPKLLEWSDLNRPLMRRLSLEAPGTYNHTVQIANLAEAACNAIGADGLLARVGAYYHDIGKLRKPQYFVENQQGRNPHDKLKPSTSAAIIRNHVREGIELAEEAGVPASVRAFIAEHHGTGPISYFLERAREREAGAVNAADFAYPGPIPQTAERAVCMLADGAEAATRALSDPTPQAIREVIERIVRQRIEQGQLRDAPLTLRQLEIVKDQLARMLVASHHQRVDYPVERPSGSVTSISQRPA